MKMIGMDWLRDLAKRENRGVLCLLGVAGVWGAVRIMRSMGLLFSDSNDLYTYYSIWRVMGYHDLADIALRQSLYLPHTWLVLTPVFIFGWVTARILMLLINVSALWYICWRLAQLTGLEPVRRILLLALFCGWLGTGLVIGLGNLALVCVAALLAAYPYNSPGKHGWLALSAMKQSLVFPVFLQLLFKRPKALLLPLAIFGVCGVAALVWAGLSVPQAVKMARGSLAAVGGWTYDHLCLRRVVAPFIASPGLASMVTWGIWFGLFAVVLRLRDGLCQLAALLVLSLLPLYHNVYDMVAAAPALAIFLRRCHLAWPALMTLALATNLAALVSPHVPGPLRPLAGAVEFAYFPLVLLSILGGLFWVERRERKAAVAAPAPVATMIQA